MVMKFFYWTLFIFIFNTTYVKANMCSLAETLDERKRSMIAGSLYYACADQEGNSEYKYKYAKRLYDGIYTEKNIYQAIYFFRAAAADNHQDSMIMLGDMALKGENKYEDEIDKKPISAMIWYSIASYYGNNKAKSKQGRLKAQLDKDVIENEVIPMVGAWVKYPEHRKKLSKEIP